jgi:isoquinoline 1-oxidoreductase beta subunit
MSAIPSDVSRRAFLKAGVGLTGGLVIAISMPGCKPAAKSSGAPTTFAANAWLHIGSDDKITFFCDKSEMGQGVYTALPMLIAEELGSADRSPAAAPACATAGKNSARPAPPRARC